MKIIDVFGICPGKPLVRFAARDMEEAAIIARHIQEAGGIPVLRPNTEVPDDFDQFVIKREKTKLEKLAPTAN
jgi:hypothetical protein